MSDVSSSTNDYLSILGTAGDNQIVTRTIIRPSSSDLTLAPGVVLQNVAASSQHCTVWDGQTNTTVCGVLLQPVVATSRATPALILAAGSVKNEYVNIYSDGDGDPNPTAAQWNQMQTQAGIVPVGIESAT